MTTQHTASIHDASPSVRDAPPLAPLTPGDHLAIVTAIIRGHWQKLRDMDLPRLAADDSFARYAARQNICQYTLQRLHTTANDALLPASWLADLRGTITRGGDHYTSLLAALEQVITAFTHAGVECLVLKGVLFAQRYYGSTELRRMSDIDLLVRPADVDRAIGVLLQLGYSCKPRRVRIRATGPQISPRILRTQHALSFRRGGVPLDLHWQFRAAPAYRLDTAALWSDAQPASWHGHNCRIPSDEYALTLLLLSIAHDIARGGCKLKHLLDGDQLLSHTNLDWPAFFSHRARENMLSICVNVLSIVLDALDGRSRYPALNTALARHDALVVAHSREASIALAQPASASELDAMRWFMKIYPVALWRDGPWLFRHTFWHPGRYASFPFRAARFAWRLFRHRSRATA